MIPLLKKEDKTEPYIQKSLGGWRRGDEGGLVFRVLLVDLGKEKEHFSL